MLYYFFSKAFYFWVQAKISKKLLVGQLSELSFASVAFYLV
jgi:hypothetical protein